VVISSRVDACPFTPLPFEGGHPSTRARQTGPRKQPQEKQTSESLAMAYTWMVSSLVWQLIGGEKYALSLGAN